MFEEITSKKAIIITPIYSGYASGAAIYYQLLYKELTKKGFNVKVISEAQENRYKKDNYYGLFPQRCGREKQTLADIFAYSVQNIKYLKIPEIISLTIPQTIIVHTSFYNFPGLFPVIMRSLITRKKPGQQYIADVRDHLMPQKRARYLNHYDWVIACSESVSDHLISCGVIKEKIVNIPVLQERLETDKKFASNLLSKMSLREVPFILYAGLIKEKKAVDLLIRSFIEYVRPEFPEVIFVLAGLIKTNKNSTKKLLKEGNVRYVGNLSRREVISLMSCAKLCVNISPNEGMPRSSLEALALGKPTLLPPNIPEFNKHCSEFVADVGNPETIAEKIIDILNTGAIPSYPVERHFPENVISKYMPIFDRF